MAIEDPKQYFSDFTVRAAVESDFFTIHRIFEEGIIFNEARVYEPAFISALTTVIIHLNDLLQKLKKVGLRISWRDDVPQSLAFDKGTDNNFDITNFIRWMRNALAHPEGDSGEIATKQISKLNIIIGKMDLPFGGAIAGGKYDDDISINFGPHAIYLKRHIWRVYMDLQTIYRDLPGSKLRIQ